MQFCSLYFRAQFNFKINLPAHQSLSIDAKFISHGLFILKCMPINLINLNNYLIIVFCRDSGFAMLKALAHSDH